MKKLVSTFFAMAILVPMLCSCASQNKTTDEMFALDTIITFNVQGENAKETIDECKNEILRLENMLSATKEGSDVYRLNHSSGEKVTVSDETAKIIEKSKEISKSTFGAFDVSVYPLVKLWGFDEKEYTVPRDSEIETALSHVSYDDIKVNDGNTVTLKEGMSVGLGAVAKGYIGERLHSIMNEQTTDKGIINLGGMVITYACSDKEMFTIGVEHPKTNEVFATFSTNRRFTVTSGAYQRYFEKDGNTYHHIISPYTGKPADSDISSVTLITDDGVSGDALSTAFYVLGVEKTLEYIKNNDCDFEVIILNSNKDELYISSSLLDNGFELSKEYDDKINIKIIG